MSILCEQLLYFKKRHRLLRYFWLFYFVGVFDTPLLAALPKKAIDALTNSVVFPKRLGNPDEFAQMCQTIVENPYLNGETIRLDGALRMV